MATRSTTTLAALGALLTATLVGPALAQQPPATAPQSPSSAQPPTTRWDNLIVTANQRQSQAQLGQDRYECHRWAVGQTGFDPSKPGGGVPPSQNASRRQEYRRAITACLEARGYTVRLAPLPYAAAPYARSPAPRYNPPMIVAPYRAPVRDLMAKPLSVQINAGINFSAGNTSDYLDDGLRFGLGVTWFPAPTLPLAFRVEGNYSWFEGRRGWLDPYTSYSYNYEQLYGGDLDLEINLDHRSGSRVYLLGGVGEYRATVDFRQFSPGFTCGYFCGAYYYPGATASATTDWHGSWNAGIGWEWAVWPRSAFFVEARYMQILPSHIRLQFVPVTFGFRF